MSTASDAVVDRLVERATQDNADIAAMLGDPDIGGSFFNGVREISNNKQKVTIYDTETGEARIIPAMYLKATMKKKRTITLPDGTAKVIDAFVPQDPETGQPYSPVPEYQTGNLKCFLHPQHPDRKWLEAIGVGMEIVCGDNQTRPAGSFKSTFQRDYHEKKKHPISWQIRENAISERKEQEAVERQERQIEAMMALAGRSGGSEASVFRCPTEGCPRFFDTEQGLKVHTNQHKE